MEDAFRQVPGVIDVASGYQGGRTANPTYGDVCSGLTGHTETVEVKFDETKVSYRQLLRLFWSLHDPTDNLVHYHDGQYKSVIFYTSESQMQDAQQSREELEKTGRYRAPIATQILAAAPFWRAEEYHQQYYAKHYAKTCSR